MEHDHKERLEMAYKAMEGTISSSQDDADGFYNELSRKYGLFLKAQREMMSSTPDTPMREQRLRVLRVIRRSKLLEDMFINQRQTLTLLLATGDPTLLTESCRDAPREEASQSGMHGDDAGQPRKTDGYKPRFTNGRRPRFKR